LNWKELSDIDGDEIFRNYILRSCIIITLAPKVMN